jgi:hypothetical protein
VGAFERRQRILPTASTLVVHVQDRPTSRDIVEGGRPLSALDALRLCEQLGADFACAWSWQGGAYLLGAGSAAVWNRAAVVRISWRRSDGVGADVFEVGRSVEACAERVHAALRVLTGEDPSSVHRIHRDRGLKPEQSQRGQKSVGLMTCGSVPDACVERLRAELAVHAHPAVTELSDATLQRFLAGGREAELIVIAFANRSSTLEQVRRRCNPLCGRCGGCWVLIVAAI